MEEEGWGRGVTTSLSPSCLAGGNGGTRKEKTEARRKEKKRWCVYVSREYWEGGERKGNK